jgi:lysophospholipase L1-like esterase
VAAETSTDMLFMNENFCGHGFAKDDTSGPCHRGAGAELWFDPTCIHPNAEGHAAIARMFLEVVDG